MNDVKDVRHLTVADIPTDVTSKAFADFRDRAAYVYIMGAFPTHIRSHSTTLLSQISHTVTERTSLDGSLGSIKLDGEWIAKLALECHPMVRRVRILLAERCRLQRGGAITQRRPYGRIPMHNPLTGQRVVVQIDGSVNDDRV